MNSSKKILVIGYSASLVGDKLKEVASNSVEIVTACGSRLEDQIPKKVIMINEAWRTGEYASNVNKNDSDYNKKFGGIKIK